MNSQTAAGYSKADGQTNLVNILMDSGNSIVIELDEKSAPITVNNFQKLVSESFYDDIIFHRIIPGFMIQGGDPKGTGTGGSDQKIKGEIGRASCRERV